MRWGGRGGPQLLIAPRKAKTGLVIVTPNKLLIRAWEFVFSFTYFIIEEEKAASDTYLYTDRVK